MVQTISTEEQIYNLQSAYNACINYIDYLNQQLSINIMMYDAGQLSQKDMKSIKSQIGREIRKTSEEAKGYHCRIFRLQQQLAI